MKIAKAFLPVALFATAACSSDPGSDDMTLVDPAEAVVADDAAELGLPEQAWAELRDARDAALSSDEEQLIRDYLIEHGAMPDRIAFDGRLVAQEGDMLHFADDILAAVERSRALERGEVVPPDGVTEKGRVFSQINSGPAFAFCASPLPACPVVPIDIADASGQNLLWLRPETNIKYFLVMPNGAPSYLRTLLGLAAARLTGVSSTDCLTPSLFEVKSSSEYAALTPAVKASSFVITFVLGSFSQVCNGGATACSVGPLRQTVTVGGQPATRLRFGHIIGLPNSPDQVGEPDTLADDTGNEAVGIVVHELLHAMGFAHISDSQATPVPGTQSGGANQTQSIMHPSATFTNPNWKDWSSAANTPALDKAMITKLYTGSCAFNAGFRTITP